jgi:hypothetical protein
MALGMPVRQYIIFNAIELLGRSVDGFVETQEVEKELSAAIGVPVNVLYFPSARFVPAEDGDPSAYAERTRAVQTVRQAPHVAVLVSDNAAEAAVVRRAIEDLIAQEGAARVSAIGADLPIRISDYSYPGSADVDVFGTRADAHRITGIDRLGPDFNLNGNGVNVVIIDTGLDLTTIQAPATWGGGWQILPGGRVPGMTTGLEALHGAMILQNVLAVAPGARIWDVPIIPPRRIDDIANFLADAQPVFDQMIADIQAQAGPPQQWVFVNAWAIFDRRSEQPLGDYTENRPGIPGSHPFIQRIEQLAQAGFDLVFCAGNCGGVCPDGRCGPNDYGPGRSIWGANAHQSVMTVGAARIDTSWCGYSSEGPGPAAKLSPWKPDLCAPSQFTDGPGYPSNLGTSAACALLGGVMAAFRSQWRQTLAPVPTPNLASSATLIGLLNANAQSVNGPNWTPRFGHGLLDARAAAAALP